MKRLMLMACALHAFAAHAQWIDNPTVNNAISTPTNSQYAASVASDGAGGAFIVWSDWRNGNGDVFAQRINANGQTLWEADGKAICTAAGEQYFPTAVADGSGGVFIAWTDNRNGSGTQDIYMQRVAGDGTLLWTANGVGVCTANGMQYNPDILSLGSGECIVAWHDDRTNANSDIYAQRLAADGSAVWTANGQLVCNAASYQQYAQLESDGAGGAFIVWQDNRSGNYDIYIQRLKGSNGDAVWAANGVALCTASGMQGDPQLVADGSGGAIVVWEDYRPGTTSDIYARRIDSGGTPQWAANGAAVCTASNYQSDPKLIADGEGGAIITWFDLRAETNQFVNWDIYAQRINSNGGKVWDSYANGLPVCVTDLRQQLPQLVTDGAGGAIITWQDQRSGVNDIYAARITATGTLPWQANGALVCNAANSQENPAIAADGNGGAIIAWADKRADSNGDLYASRINNGGVLPIQLLSFAGAATSSGNYLSWTVDREEAGLMYELQASANGSSFVPVNNQQARNLPGKQQYNFMHTGNAAMRYYRLRLKDANGKISYSHVVILAAQAPGIFSVYPTLTHDRINISTGKASGELRILTSAGQPAMRMHIQAQGTIQVNIGHLKAGTYICTFNGEQARFVKL